MSIFSTSLDAIYASPIATNATFGAFAGVARVVDKTLGVDLSPGGSKVSVGTVAPVALVRRSELLANGVTDLSTLKGTPITFNGNSWSIVNYLSIPQPGGESEGEVRLQLRKL